MAVKIMVASANRGKIKLDKGVYFRGRHGIKRCSIGYDDLILTSEKAGKADISFLDMDLYTNKSPKTNKETRRKELYIYDPMSEPEFYEYITGREKELQQQYPPEKRDLIRIQEEGILLITNYLLLKDLIGQKIDLIHFEDLYTHVYKLMPGAVFDLQIPGVPSSAETFGVYREENLLGTPVSLVRYKRHIDPIK